jgi:hypothetical protein
MLEPRAECLSHVEFESILAWQTDDDASIVNVGFQ